MGMRRSIPSQLGPSNQDHIGNLIINFNVAFPDKLTDEQISALSKIL
jgi:DnaJ-class molecular chaperone